jgi:hypothetical protein
MPERAGFAKILVGLRGCFKNCCACHSGLAGQLAIPMALRLLAAVRLATPALGH